VAAPVGALSRLDTYLQVAPAMDDHRIDDALG